MRSSSSRKSEDFNVGDFVVCVSPSAYAVTRKGNGFGVVEILRGKFLRCVWFSEGNISKKSCDAANLRGKFLRCGPFWVKREFFRRASSEERLLYEKRQFMAEV